MAITRGIDVSRYQGDINWDKVGTTSYDFAVARMTLGRGTQDPLGHRYLSEMVFRVPVAGAYGVVGITEPVTDGAKFLLDEISAEVDPTKILVMLDAENFRDGSHPTIDQVDRYATTIHDKLGRWPIAYVPKWWLNQHGYTARGRNLANCRWAPSHYLPAPWTEEKLQANKPTLEFGFTSLAWLQYTDAASVPGVSGPVDANVFYGTLSDLKARLLGQAQGDDMTGEEHDALIEARDLLKLLLYGDRRGEGLDTHDFVSMEGHYDILKGLQGDLDAVKAAVQQATDPAAVAALVAGKLEITGIETDPGGVVRVTFGPKPAA